MMRETGPVRKGLAGDDSTTAGYIAQGRTFLGVLKNRMKLGNLSQLSQTITLPDGTVFQVSSIFGQDTVRITTLQSSNASPQVPPQHHHIPPYRPVGTRTFAICNGDIPNFFIDIEGEIFSVPFDDEVRPVVIDGVEYTITDNKAHVMPVPYGPVPIGSDEGDQYLAQYIMVGVVDPSQGVLVPDQPAAITVKDKDGNAIPTMLVQPAGVIHKTYGKVVPAGLAVVTNPIALAAKDIIFSGTTAGAPTYAASGTLKVQASLALVAANNDLVLNASDIQVCTINGVTDVSGDPLEYTLVPIPAFCNSAMSILKETPADGQDAQLAVSVKQINDPTISQLGLTYAEDTGLTWSWQATGGDFVLEWISGGAEGGNLFGAIGPGNAAGTFVGHGIMTVTDVVGNVVSIPFNVSRTLIQA